MAYREHAMILALTREVEQLREANHMLVRKYDEATVTYGSGCYDNYVVVNLYQKGSIRATIKWDRISLVGKHIVNSYRSKEFHQFMEVYGERCSLPANTNYIKLVGSYTVTFENGHCDVCTDARSGNHINIAESLGLHMMVELLDYCFRNGHPVPVQIVNA
jgi:hypothetical protein